MDRAGRAGCGPDSGRALRDRACTLSGLGLNGEARMTIRLPNGLDDLNWMVGTDFPDAGEDGLWRLADAWANAAAELRGLTPDGDRLGRSVIAALDADTALAFGELWQRLASAPTGFVERLAEVC